MDYLIIILFLICAFIIWRKLKDFKVPKLNSLVMVTGGVKTGKSTLSVWFVYNEYKKRLKAYRFRKFVCKLIHHEFLLEEPLIYSNVPLDIKYKGKQVPIYVLDTLHLTRKRRFNYGSVVYMQEASLISDSQCIYDKELNLQLLVFYKLFGHMTQGGVCIADTQCVSDVHFSEKRSLSEYYYIHHLAKVPILPFLIAFATENRYSEDGSIVTINSGDVEDNLKKILISKKVWKMYDCYSYSSLTDGLAVLNNRWTVDDGSLKVYHILSFRKELNKICCLDYKKEVSNNE